MANLPEVTQWEDGVYQIETDDPVLGGQDGIANQQAKQLANRTGFLRSLINAVIQAAGISPGSTAAAAGQLLSALRGEGVFETQDLFDNSTKAATTAYVRRALGSYGGIALFTEAAQLTTGHVGMCIVLRGGAPYTITMPALDDVPQGSAILIMNRTDGTITIAGSGSDAINTTQGNGAASIPLLAGDDVLLIRLGTLWRMTGTARLAYSESFGASLGNNGYQRLPSGLILQWGRYRGGASSGTINFPLQFPNSCYVVTATATTSSTGESVKVSPISTSQFSFEGSASVNFDWQAIGR